MSAARYVEAALADLGERDAPPSQRWARLVWLGEQAVLEMRDPNHGTGDRTQAPRYQYLRTALRIWTRTLPGETVGDAWTLGPGQDDPARWRPMQRATTGPLAALARGLQTPDAPMTWTADRDPDGYGSRPHRVYAMGPSGNDMWAPTTDVPCPVPGCSQTLVWYEAGYVPGYRVCMASGDDGAGYVDTLRHRFCLDSSGGGEAALVELGEG